MHKGFVCFQIIKWAFHPIKHVYLGSPELVEGVDNSLPLLRWVNGPLHKVLHNRNAISIYHLHYIPQLILDLSQLLPPWAM